MAHQQLVKLPETGNIQLGQNYQIQKTPTSFTSAGGGFGGTISEGQVFEGLAGPAKTGRFFTFTGGQIRPIAETGQQFRSQIEATTGAPVGGVQENVIQDYYSYANRAGILGLGEKIGIKDIPTTIQQTAGQKAPIDITSEINVPQEQKQAQMAVFKQAQQQAQVGGQVQAAGIERQPKPSLGRLLGPREFEALVKENIVGPAQFNQYFNRDERGNIYLRPDAPTLSARIDLQKQPLITKTVGGVIDVGAIQTDLSKRGTSPLVDQTVGKVSQLLTQKSQQAQQETLAQSNLPPKPVPTDESLTQDPIVLTRLGQISDITKDQVFKKYRISEHLKNIEDLESRIVSENKVYFEAQQEIANDPDFPKRLAARRIAYIEEARNKDIGSLQLQLGFLTKNYDRALEAAKDELGVSEKALLRQQEEQNRIRDDARAQIQQLISTGGLATINTNDIRTLAQTSGYSEGIITEMQKAVKSGNERKIAQVNTKLELETQRLETQQAQEERLRIGKDVAPSVVSEAQPTVSTGNVNKDVDSILSGVLNLNDLSTAKNYRGLVAGKLNIIIKDSLKSGDINTIMKASVVYDKEPDSTFLTSMDKAISVINQLGTLQQSIAGQNTGPLVGAFRERNPWDTQAQIIKAQLNAIVPNLARGIYGEVGVLTDNDIKQYAKTIPNLTSTEAVRNGILYITLNQIQKSIENKIRNQAAGQRDMSGYAGIYEDINKLSQNILVEIQKTLPTKQQTSTQRLDAIIGSSAPTQKPTQPPQKQPNIIQKILNNIFGTKFGTK